MNALGAWMNGERVGTWRVERGIHRFVYDEGWMESPRRRSLSLSLPVTPARQVRGPAVAHYFDNLLPDNEHIRARLARRFALRDAGTFTLLEAIGRDCVGAVQLMPDGTQPEGWDRVEYRTLDEARTAAILRAVATGTGPGAWGEDEEPFRISIAGAQEKTGLLRLPDGRWALPHGATPTTHILKLPLGLVGGSRRVDLGDSVANEWVCSRLLAALGLPVARTEMACFEDQQALVVERFDRAWMDGGRWIARLPQEDFCQALGLPPSAKYEADGGPGLADGLRLLSGSRQGAKDASTFQRAQLAFWLMAATDGHAKNFSIFLHAGDAYALTPLYDVLSMWPYIGDGPNQWRRQRARLAMAMRSKNVHWELERIRTRHWHQWAMKNGGPAAWKAMLGLVDRVEAAVDQVQAELPADFPPRTWATIADGMRWHLARFREGLAEIDAVA
ncbi:type II toxin-antitoxin system HipA family toxin [Ideonella sp. YS5]|uniref:type II toxin-antitoxin system HipA family toxin n=1 Tax=Ideonella sp. YS5 TaxID=3453714 RepID=UPI003EEA174F